MPAMKTKRTGSRLLLVAKLAVAMAMLTACTPIPGEAPEEFFTRCMADRGFEVSNAQIELGEERSVRFSQAGTDRVGFDSARDGCLDEVIRRYEAATG